MYSDNIDELVDMSMIQFGQMCSSCNVNDLSTLKSIISMTIGEINFKLAEILRFRYININMTEAEYNQFISQVASMGGIIANSNSKLVIIDYYMEELTPSCFKKPKLDK